MPMGSLAAKMWGNVGIVHDGVCAVTAVSVASSDVAMEAINSMARAIAIDFALFFCIFSLSP